MNAPAEAHSRQNEMYRHNYCVRICHWINVLAVGYLAVSGMAILLDYPELYWGVDGYVGEPAFRLADLGITMEGDRLWGRNMHFLFTWIFAINGLVYLIWNLARRGLLRRLLPSREQLRWSHLREDIRDHARLRHPRGEAARHYNVLQKIAYLTVIFIVCPMIVVTGLAQSPGLTAPFPELISVFGGRQTARSLHFIFGAVLILFLLVHVFQVLVSGPLNQIRSMITGRFVLPRKNA